MQIGEQGPKSNSATIILLLTVATLVALAPLCSALITVPAISGAAVLQGGHAQSQAPTTSLAIAAKNNARETDHCALYSCCAATDFTNTDLPRQTFATAALAAIATPVAESRGLRTFANTVDLDATAGAVAGQVPLRL